ncbi:conserved hypothetical protein [Gloeothece citriformis PCC 7424]|uniref:DUF1190 domain-containing protein n=1 Tax=Gloeothece citriformis (strain PCC 7424) TaxID=65393 RepID=B7KEX6_GLOC7|nr:hypothetical protein [Gloeothece citriformis]ACK70432.1 conserved hypothetical protein [Gloeothece citriformis PCC 7424]
MYRQLIAVFIALTLCWTTVACSSNTTTSPNQNFTNNVSVESKQLPNGRYPVQQATYDDVEGVYTLMLLGANPPVYRTTNLQMARLSEEAIANGEKTYLDINGDQAVMYLTEDYKIEYVHNVTETQVNPQTGQQETVIVRQQSGFWAPFAGALAGQALGSLLFTPHYYVPPVYQPGGVLTGYGGYGRSYNQALESYQTRYNAPPPVVKNRQSLRTTGNLRTSSSNQTIRRSSPNTTKSTGSGYGTSTLRNSGQSGSTRSKSRPSFGSGAGSRNKSFGGSRRRR